MKAFIRKGKGDALWLRIDRDGSVFEYPIQKDEVKLILQACMDYIIDKD